jgi:hypothetical protein
MPTQDLFVDPTRPPDHFVEAEAAFAALSRQPAQTDAFVAVAREATEGVDQRARVSARHRDAGDPHCLEVLG